MLSLREALGKVEQAPTQPTVRQLAGWLDASPASLRDLLQRAAQFERIVIADLSFLAQNMALMVFPGKYGGVDRNAAVASLIAHLGAGQFDVVGLSECFANDERGRIKSELGAVYAFSMEGPLERDADSDGGLLLLSRHPIIQRDTSIFRMCYDVDCLADKGILHARIQVPGHPTPYDIYLTHLQDPDADSIGGALNYGPGSNAYDKIRYQLDHVASFVQACGSPECPAILMGDLNVDALNQPRYDDMRTRLGDPTDLWTISGKGSPGFTWDAVKSYGPDSPPLPPEDPSREQSGQRVDYFWSWRDGHLWLPNSAGTEVVIWEASPGRQISDHYGLTTCQTSVCLRKVDTALRSRA